MLSEFLIFSTNAVKWEFRAGAVNTRKRVIDPVRHYHDSAAAQPGSLRY